MKPNNFVYCPYCKNPLKSKPNNYICIGCDQIIYKNSKPCASVLPVKDGKVLLSIRAITPKKGCIDTIGGFLHYGEKPQSAALREAHEETSLKMEIIDLLGVSTDIYGSTGIPTINVDYVTKIVSGNPKPKDDVEKLLWFSIDSLPNKNLAFKSVNESLKNLKKWYALNNNKYKGI